MRHVRVFIEDFVLGVKDFSGLLSCLILESSVLNNRQKGLLFDNRLVLFNNISVSCRQTLNVLKILLMGLLMDPRVNYLDFLGLELLLLLVSQQGWLFIILGTLSSLVVL